MLTIIFYAGFHFPAIDSRNVVVAVGRGSLFLVHVRIGKVGLLWYSLGLSFYYFVDIVLVEIVPVPGNCYVHALVECKEVPVNRGRLGLH